MRIETRELGLELKREGRAYLEYAVFGALRQFVPQVQIVNVCLRRRGPAAGVTCVMVAELLPSGRAVAVFRAKHPYAAIDRAAAELRHRIEHETAPVTLHGELQTFQTEIRQRGDGADPALGKR